MAFAHVGAVGSANSKTGNQTSIVMNVDNTVEVDNIIVLCVAKDNATTTFADNDEYTSVTDSQSNVWVKDLERTNAANTKASTVGAVFHSVITTELVGTTDTITVNFEPDNSNDASAVCADEFTYDNSTTLTVIFTNELQGDNSDLNAPQATGLEEVEHFSTCGMMKETTGVVYSPVAGTEFTSGPSETTGGGAASNQSAHGLWRIVTNTAPGMLVNDNLNADWISLAVIFNEVSAGAGFPEAFDHLSMMHNS